MRTNRTIVLFLITALAGAAWLTTAVAGQNDKNERQAAAVLQAAKNKEQVDGNLEAAIKQYKDVVSKYSSQRAIVADALIHVAECYRLLGDSESQKVYQRIVREFADQKEIAAEAGRRLAALGTPSTDSSKASLLWTPDGVEPMAVSPDGRWMGLDKGHGAEVLVRNMATGEMRSISTDADPPALSPDGRLIAYNFWGRDLLSVGDRGALRVIANEAGSRPRIIVSNPPDVRYFSPAAFSPDSKSLLVIVVHQDWTRQLAWVSVADGNVRVLKSLGWSLRGVDGKPSVSPDGRFIAYSALAVSPSSQSGPINPTDQNIYILASDGSVQNTVVQGTNINHSPQWTPDGTRLLFLSNRRGNGFDLWSVVEQSGRAASEPPSLLRELSGTTNAIGMTRQGSFYYMNTQTESDDIFAVDLNPSTAKVLSPPTRVPLNLVGSNRGPSWSPDGNFLAFKRRHSGTSTSYDLVIQSLKTKQEQTITTGFTMGGRAVQWFHHSNEVLHPGGWRINLETKEVKQIPHLPNSNLSYSGLLQLSPDDKVYFVAAGEKASAAGVAGAMNRIAVIDVNSGQEVRVLELNEMATILGIALSPDGRTLAVKGRPKQLRTPGRKSDFEVQLARIGIDGSDYNVLYAPFLIQQAAWGETLTWTKDGKAILFGESGEFSTPDFGINHIMRIPAEGGMPEPTGLQGTSEGTLNLDLNVDGSKAIFNNLETPLSDLWRIDIDKVSSTSKNAH